MSSSRFDLICLTQYKHRNKIERNTHFKPPYYRFLMTQTASEKTNRIESNLKGFEYNVQRNRLTKQ